MIISEYTEREKKSKQCLLFLSLQHHLQVKRTRNMLTRGTATFLIPSNTKYEHFCEKNLCQKTLQCRQKSVNNFSCSGHCNKMAGYHWHIFRSSVLLKMPLKRMKALFLKKYCFFVKFSNFSKFKNFLFFDKNLTIKVEKTFSGNNIL